MKSVLVSLMFLFAAPAFSTELSPITQNEIAYLFSYMESSGCEFNRNGSWHNASESSAHIAKKYQYLLHRDLLTSAESFIIGAASESSISKTPYLVRCPGSPVVESGTWFRSALEKFRQASKKNRL